MQTCLLVSIDLTNCTIRVFYPPPPAVKGPLPIFIWYHGGGMVMGLLGADNAFCTRVATTSRCAVIAVGYRLAPEHPFPAGHNDAWDGELECLEW
jgi:acetyl esterase